MTEEEMKQWILSMSTEHKIFLLNKAIEDGEMGVHMMLTKILLDAPIKDGGLPSELIPSP